MMLFILMIYLFILIYSEKNLPRSACHRSTKNHIHIAAKTAKKMMVSHRGVSAMKRVSSSISVLFVNEFWARRYIICPKKGVTILR